MRERPPSGCKGASRLAPAVALAALLACPVLTWAAAGPAELTAFDLATRPEVTSSDLTVFGLKLGMTKEAVLGHLEEKNLLWGYYNGYLLTDKKFADIVYVFDRTDQGALGSALLRMNFSQNGMLEAITLYPAMAKHLVGESVKLVDQEVLEPSVRRRLLGGDGTKESEELPIIDLKLDIFHYMERGFQVRHKHSYSKRTDEVYFSIVPTHLK